MSSTRWDSLTHCLAPRFFRTELADAVSVARRGRQPISVVWLDVDECAVANQDHGFEKVEILWSDGEKPVPCAETA